MTSFTNGLVVKMETDGKRLAVGLSTAHGKTASSVCFGDLPLCKDQDPCFVNMPMNLR